MSGFSGFTIRRVNIGDVANIVALSDQKRGIIYCNTLVCWWNLKMVIIMTVLVLCVHYNGHF